MPYPTGPDRTRLAIPDGIEGRPYRSVDGFGRLKGSARSTFYELGDSLLHRTEKVVFMQAGQESPLVLGRSLSSWRSSATRWSRPRIIADDLAIESPELPRMRVERMVSCVFDEEATGVAGRGQIETAGLSSHTGTLGPAGMIIMFFGGLSGSQGTSQPWPGASLHLRCQRSNNDLIRTLVSDTGPNPTLAAPWGVAIAPAGWGQFGGDLLVGNNNPGPNGLTEINAYNLTTGAFEGTLTLNTGQPFSATELWAMSFGNGGGAGSTNTLFFTAGLDNNTNGLIGAISVQSVPEPSSAVLGLIAAGVLVGGWQWKNRRHVATS